MLAEKLKTEWSPRNPKHHTEYAPMSNKKVYWECEKGHEWEAVIADRSRGTNCPYCGNRIILKGFNDLAHLFPDIASEWSSNNSKKSDEVGAGTSYNAEWICNKEKHTWKTQVCKRTVRNLGCPYCSNQRILVGYNDLATTQPKMAAEWSSKNKFSPTETTSGASTKVYWECSKGHEWFSSITSRTFYQTSCPQCAAHKYSSKGEEEVSGFLESLGIDIEKNTRSIIPPFEIDIYVPSKKIAIEYNGIYWHSEDAGKDKWYHYDKWKRCYDKGIQLITVWEDDWNNNRTVIEQMIKHKLNVSDQKKVYARNTIFCEVSKEDAKNFLNTNHIQGYRHMSRNFGLRDKSSNELMSVMSFSIRTNCATLDRYATSVVLSGGFTKLLKNSIAVLPEKVDKIITFSNRNVSDGGLYANNGFIVDKELEPDYCYMYKKERHHKFLFRKARFKSDPNLKYSSDKTEKELAKINNLRRIWDSGKIRWIMYKEKK